GWVCMRLGWEMRLRVVFFFSSRRRHTRCYRDWSSDVCSSDLSRDAGVVVAPAMGFYGGWGDLLATAAMGEWDATDEICIAIALDSWKPTRGTRLTGQRNPGRHFIFSNNTLKRADPPPARKWNFPPPFGEQDMV